MILPVLSLASIASSGALAWSLAAAPESETIVVLPLDVDGELPQKWRDDAQRRIRAGFERSDLAIVEAGPDSRMGCRDKACIRALAGTASHVARPRLRVSNERDYEFTLDVASTKTGDVVATVRGECDLCGFEEVGALIDAKSVSAATAIEQLRGAVASVEIATTPAGATVAVDDVEVGTTPLDLQLAAGVHRVRVTKPGFRAQAFEYEAIEGLRKRIDVPLVADAPDTSARDARRARALVVSGGVIGGLGIAGLATGAALLAIDGRPHRRDCQEDVEGNCRFLYGTKNGGIATIAIGAAATIVGVTLVAVGARKQKKSRRDLGVRFVPSAGLALRF